MKKIYTKYLAIVAAIALIFPMHVQAKPAKQSPSTWYSIREYTYKKLNKPVLNNQVNPLLLLSLGVALTAHHAKAIKSPIVSGATATLHAFASPNGKFLTTLIKSFALHLTMSYITGGLSTLYPGFLQYGASVPANILRFFFKDILISACIIQPCIAAPINHTVDAVSATVAPAQTQEAQKEKTDQSSIDKKKKKKKKKKEEEKKLDVKKALAYLASIEHQKK